MALKIGKGTLAGIYNKLLQGGMAAALTSSFMAPLAQAHEIHSKTPSSSSVSAVEVKSNGEIAISDSKYGNYVVHPVKSFSNNMMIVTPDYTEHDHGVSRNLMAEEEGEDRQNFKYTLFFKNSDRNHNMITSTFNNLKFFMKNTTLDIKIEDVLPEGLRGKNIKSGDDYYNYVLEKHNLTEKQLNELMNGFAYHHEMFHYQMFKSLLENKNVDLPDDLKDDREFFKKYVEGNVSLRNISDEELLKKKFFIDVGPSEAMADFNAYISMKNFMENSDEYKNKDVDGILRDAFLVPRAINANFNVVRMQKASKMLEEGSELDKSFLKIELLESEQMMTRDGHDATILTGLSLFEEPEKFKDIDPDNPDAVFNAFMEHFSDKFDGTNPYSVDSPEYKNSIMNGIEGTFRLVNESEGIHEDKEKTLSSESDYDLLDMY